ncbi:MAG: tRNA lysidine(34) synthetase TilS [Gammaproteobacteria bacterium]|nr:tRNA lysidine(34) synthetase TilS [Gammaproteobacteria bacterium]
MSASRRRRGVDPVQLLQSKISGASGPLAVALSGGRDSVALLLACVALRESGLIGAKALRAIHIDHGLQSQSRAWARECRALTRELEVPLTVRRVQVTLARGESLEAIAREQRYRALSTLLRRDERLLTAHHLDDQAETLLLQLLRGAGVRGLAAMPEVMTLGRGSLVRPWLAVPRSQIEAWLRARGRHWIEDPSNQDLRFDRNYLRQSVMPTLTARWPSAHAVIARSAAHLGEAQALLNEYVNEDLARLRAPTSRTAPTASAGETTLDWRSLARFSVARQRQVLRAWLSAAGLRLPDAIHLERIRCELPAARSDAQPVVRWAGGEVRRYRSRLYALPIQSPRVNDEGAADRLWHWRVGQRLSLGGAQGSLRLEADPHGPLSRRALPRQLWVRRRAGGESIALQAAGGRRRVKALLREAQILPWWRERVPLIGVDEEVIAVADLFIAARYRASGDEPARDRLRLVWERPSDWQVPID